MKSEWADDTVQAYHGNLSGKQAHMQFARERLATAISAHWATVDSPGLKKWNLSVWADLHIKKKEDR